MSRKFLYTGLLLLALFFGCNVLPTATLFAQSNPQTSITAAFDKYKTQYIQEKIYVHTDKDSYVSREILWFRIYCVDAFYNKSSDVSRMAYVEILDRNNLPVLQQKVSLLPGQDDGSMVIPVNIPSGMYRFRAYTNWMKNFSPENYFEKAIRIINPQNIQPDTASSGSKKYDVQFFPEGGNLVQDIETHVGFRITDAFGNGLWCSGTIVSGTGDTIVRFQPLHLGLGNFIFTPKAGQTYQAIIRFPGGEELTKAMPAVFPRGYVMNLTQTADGGISLNVKAPAELNGYDVYLFVHGRHSSLPVSRQKITNQTAGLQINPADLEEGITQMTLFDEMGQPVCERLYFKYPQKSLNISLETKPEYNTRKEVELNISAASGSGKSLNTDMSLAIFRVDSLQQTDDNDISSYLYLTSDIGNFETPSFYFRDDINGRQADMNNLMLTHGWRRFKWKELFFPGQNLTFAPEHNGHIITGKLVSNISGKPVAGIPTYLSIPSTRTEFRVTTSRADGTVRFEVPAFYGSDEIILQTNPEEDSTCHVDIQSPFSNKFSSFPLPKYIAPGRNSPELLDQTIAEQVKHIYNGPKLNQLVQQPVDTNSFYVEPDEKYFLDNYTRFQTMEEVIREYVVSTNVTQKRGKFQLAVVNKPMREYFSQPPLILIDGVPFFDANELFQQDPAKVRRLDLITHEYSLGRQVFNGVVNLTTYHGDLNGIQLNTHPSVIDYPGIPAEREFFAPVYQTEAQINSRMPDYRTLLYWAPQISTGKDANKLIQFYTSDLPGKYAVVVMALSKNGEPGTRTIYFTVTK